MSDAGNPSGSGVLSGLEVLDLSWGIAGPMTGMLLADHGARVTRIEPPAGDPFAELSGARVWSRGKRRATLDLRDEADRGVFLSLARRADVVIESFGPAVAAKLGIDHATLLATNPRLIHCSITGYGETGKHARRPAYDALVAARTGQPFESRGVAGTTIGRLAREVLPGAAPGRVPHQCEPTGPLFSNVPWIGLAFSARRAPRSVPPCSRARSPAGVSTCTHRCCRARSRPLSAPGSGSSAPVAADSTRGSSTRARRRGSSRDPTTAGPTTGWRSRASS